MTGRGSAVRPRARVIGIGQPLVGDDAVGLEVVRWLADEGAPEGVELVRNAEPTELLPLLEGVGTVVVVDAVVGGRLAGRVVTLDGRRLGAIGPRLYSTHGIGVAEMLSLACALEPERVAANLAVIGVTIRHPVRSGEGLSLAVAAAVPRAAAAVRRLVSKA